MWARILDSPGVPCHPFSVYFSLPSSWMNCSLLLLTIPKITELRWVFMIIHLGKNWGNVLEKARVLSDDDDNIQRGTLWGFRKYQRTPKIALTTRQWLGRVWQGPPELWLIFHWPIIGDVARWRESCQQLYKPLRMLAAYWVGSAGYHCLNLDCTVPLNTALVWRHFTIKSYLRTVSEHQRPTVFITSVA